MNARAHEIDDDDGEGKSWVSAIFGNEPQHQEKATPYINAIAFARFEMGLFCLLNKTKT